MRGERQGKKRKSLKSESGVKKTFGEHLQELKNRVFFWLGALILFSLIGYFFSPEILSVLSKPLNQPLYYSSPAGGLNFILSISLFAGFLLSVPILIYEVLVFVAPAMPGKVIHSMMVVLLSSCLLLISGLTFAYLVVLPAALNFLSTFGGDGVKSLITTSEYFAFATGYLMSFGLMFQLPLVMVLVNKINRLDIKKLMGLERWVILFSFVAAAILTPTPDIVNQCVMAVPIIMLYQVSVGVIWFLNRNSHLT